MGIPAEGIDVRMLRLDKENRILHQDLESEREQKKEAIDLLLAFHKALRDHSGWEGENAFQPAVTLVINTVPGLGSFVRKQRNIKETRDKDLRQNALSRMSRDEACALGVLEQWQVVNAVHEMIEREPMTGRSIKTPTLVDYPVKEVPSTFADDPTKEHPYGS